MYWIIFFVLFCAWILIVLYLEVAEFNRIRTLSDKLDHYIDELYLDRRK